MSKVWRKHDLKSEYDILVIGAGGHGLAPREDYSSIKLVNRRTTSGMAVDQNKTGNMNKVGAVGLVLAISTR